MDSIECLTWVQHSVPWKPDTGLERQEDQLGYVKPCLSPNQRGPSRLSAAKGRSHVLVITLYGVFFKFLLDNFPKAEVTHKALDRTQPPNRPSHVDCRGTGRSSISIERNSQSQSSLVILKPVSVLLLNTREDLAV